MSNPRNILSQQDVVDGLLSSNDVVPLSANQGRVLSSQIMALENQVGLPIEVFFDPTVGLPILELPFGPIWWANTIDQPFLLTTVGVTPAMTCSLIVEGVTTPLGDPSVDSFPKDRGSFSVPLPGVQYFSATGAPNTAFGVREPGSRMLIDAVYTVTATQLLYHLKMNVFNVTANRGLITGNLVTISTNNFFTIQGETPVAQFSSGDYPFSFGDIENSTNAGVVMPMSGKLSSFSFKTSTNILTLTSFTVVKNGVPTNSIINIFPGPNSGFGPLFLSPLSFEAGDEINLVAPTGTPDIRFLDITLSGQYNS